MGKGRGGVQTVRMENLPVSGSRCQPHLLSLGSIELRNCSSGQSPPTNSGRSSIRLFSMWAMMVLARCLASLQQTHSSAAQSTDVAYSPMTPLSLSQTWIGIHLNQAVMKATVTAANVPSTMKIKPVTILRSIVFLILSSKNGR